MRAYGLLAVVVVSLVLASCGKKEDEYTAGTFNAVYNQSLKNGCIQCHAPGTPAYTGGVLFDVTSKDTAYATIFRSVAGLNSAGGCRNLKIVEPSNTAKSYILPVVSSQYYADPYGGVSCTPFNGHLGYVNLSGDELSSMVKWIQEGAQNN